MWFVIMRAPRPDASVWAGRRGLAAIDAVVWPLLWVTVIRHAATPTGLVSPVAFAMGSVAAVLRLHRAIWVNERYWFTTWRWGKVVAAMLLTGWVLKLMIVA